MLHVLLKQSVCSIVYAISLIESLAEAFQKTTRTARSCVWLPREEHPSGLATVGHVRPQSLRHRICSHTIYSTLYTVGRVLLQVLLQKIFQRFGRTPTRKNMETPIYAETKAQPKWSWSTLQQSTSRAHGDASAAVTSLLVGPNPPLWAQQILGVPPINTGILWRVSCSGRITMAPQLLVHDGRIAGSQGRRSYRGRRAFGTSDGSDARQERLD